ncbi:transposase [Streptomyces sp. RK31]|nr:transposase [Streptomyces sp. RK31]
MLADIRMRDRPPRVWGDADIGEGTDGWEDRPPCVWGKLPFAAPGGKLAGQTPMRVRKTLAHLCFWRSVRRFLFTLHDLAVRVRAAAWSRSSLVVWPELPNQGPSSKIIQVVDRGVVVRRHELTDQEWELLAPLISRAATGRPRVEDRQVINGMVYKIRAGISWRDLPEHYGPWKTVYTRFRRYAIGTRRGEILLGEGVQGQTVGCGHRADLLRASTSRRSAGGRSHIRALTPTPGQTPGSGGNPYTTSQDATVSRTGPRALGEARCRTDLHMREGGPRIAQLATLYG